MQSRFPIWSGRRPPLTHAQLTFSLLLSHYYLEIITHSIHQKGITYHCRYDSQASKDLFSSLVLLYVNPLMTDDRLASDFTASRGL
jgi:hypothetical protein